MAGFRAPGRPVPERLDLSIRSCDSYAEVLTLVYAACAQISILWRRLLLTMRMRNSKSAISNVKGATFNVGSAVSALDGFGPH